MRTVFVIRVSLLVAAILLILLGSTFVIDYQLNKDDPYFEDPDTVKLTYSTAIYFFVMGGILVLFGIFYRENANLIINLIITFFLILVAYTGHSLAFTEIGGDILSCDGYERPELVIYLGVSLFLVSLVALVLLLIQFSAKLFRESAG